MTVNKATIIFLRLPPSSVWATRASPYFSSTIRGKRQPMTTDGIKKTDTVVYGWISTILYTRFWTVVLLSSTRLPSTATTSVKQWPRTYQRRRLSSAENPRQPGIACCQYKGRLVQIRPRRTVQFSYSKTVSSTLLSVRQTRCRYIDVLQLHDPE